MSTESGDASAGQVGQVQVEPADFQRAHSITILVHGVGDTTSSKLLESAVEGYRWSGFGVDAIKGELEDCPSLAAGGKGCECVLLGPEDARHLVIALPWSHRRTRLEAIARTAARVASGLGIAALFAYFFGEKLESLAVWIHSNKFIAYGALFAFAGLMHLVDKKKNKQFQPPSFAILLGPVILLLLLQQPDWLWMPVAVLIGILWLIVVVTLLRNLFASKVAPWCFALACLVITLTSVSAGLAYVAYQYTGPAASEQRYKYAKDLFLAEQARAEQSLSRQVVERMLNQPMDAEFESSSVSAAAPVSVPVEVPEVSQLAIHRDGSPAIPTQQAQKPSSILDIPPPSPETRAKLFPNSKKNTNDPEMLDERVVTAGSWASFKLTLGVFFFVSLGLWLVAKSWGWLLDFLLDVLHYTGSKEHRESLLDGVSNALKWLHEKAPDASLIVVGHSLGSVIVTHVLARQPASESFLRRAVLITLGSPLNYLSRLAPEIVQSPGELAKKICAHVRWINMWRSKDPIGKSFPVTSSNFTQYCVAEGGHGNYWAVGKVWVTVAREALVESDSAENERPTDSERCLAERFLWAGIGAAIVITGLAGYFLWAVKVPI